MTNKIVGDPNQLAGHEPRVHEWEESEAGKEYLAKESERQKSYDAEQKAYEESVKALEEKAEAEADYSEQEEPEENDGDFDFGGDDDKDKAPAKSANKDEWVAYAVAQGADEDEANSLTKDDLIAAYGG